MRLALVTSSTRPRGGVVHTLGLAEALAAEGVDVTVVSLGRGRQAGFYRPVDPAVRVDLVPFPDVDGEDVVDRSLRSIDVLAAGVDWGSFDVVHAQDCTSANAVPGCLRTVHHLVTSATPALAACHERALREPRGHVCVSEAVAAQVRAGWGLDPVVIPSGVDAERFAFAAGPAGADARQAWRGRLGSLWVLAVGGIEPRKGTLELVEAFAVARDRLPDHQLVVAGEPLLDHRPYRAEVAARASALGVELVVLGPVPDGELPALVAASDVLAMPSTDEGFGLAAMEALAAGTPVVLSDLPVFHEVFADAARFPSGPGPTGLADALVAAVHHPDPGRAAVGRALAEAHTWRRAALDHLAFYEAQTRPPERDRGFH